MSDCVPDIYSLPVVQGIGKRLPVAALPLQQRAGTGRIAMKFKEGDTLAALHVVSRDLAHAAGALAAARALQIANACRLVSLQMLLMRSCCWAPATAS